MRKNLHNKFYLKGLICLLLIIMFNFSSVAASKSIEHILTQKRITLNHTNSSIKDLLVEIRNQSGIDFIYDENILPSTLKTSVNVKDVSVKEAITQILNGTKYTFTIESNGVVIKETPQAEKIVIMGKVIDEANKPIAGATVIVENSTNGAITDPDGVFMLTISSATNIEVSFIGYETQKVAVSKANSNVVVTLKASAIEVDDVVVTGVFNKSRESYTGAVTTVTEKELKAYRGQNMLQTLSNIDPAFTIAQDNYSGSNPNRTMEVTIRGNSSLNQLDSETSSQLNAPLVIMDGFEVTMDKLMDFNDDEIESITILKDASSTAMYGSRGANGVVVIKTKDPVAGKLKVYVQAGLNLEIPDLSSYNLMNAFEKLELEKSVGFYSGENYTGAVDPYEYMRLSNLYNERLTTALQGETEWIREPVRVGVGRRLNARIEGGSEEFRWGISASNNVTTGTMKGSERQVSSFSITLNYNYKNLLFRNVSSLDMTKADNGSYGSFSDYVGMNTYNRIVDEDGNLIPSWTSFSENSYYDIDNPIVDALLDVKDYSKNTTMRNIFSIDWTVLSGLIVRGQFGVSKSFDTSDLYYPAEHSMFDDEDDFFAKGSYDYSTGEGFDMEGSINVSYSKAFNDKHVIYAGFDGSLRQSDSYMYSFSVQGLLNPNFNDFSNALDYAEGTVPTGTDTNTASVGFTGTVNYTYDQRYFVDTSFRVDGSSQFGANNRYAPFWSLGFGWNIHHEDFMKNQNVVNLLRLRASTGESGSQQFSSYQARSMYEFNSSSRYLYWTSATLAGLANEDLTWQTTSQQNIGLEAQFLGGRINAGIDVYYKATDGLLSSIDITQSHGFSSYMANVGKTENYGYEAVLGGYIIRDLKRDFSLNVIGRLAYTKNNIVELSDDMKSQSYANLIGYSGWGTSGTVYEEGRSQNAIYAVRSLGIDPASGNELYLDADGNVTKTWNAADRVYVGDAQPSYQGTASTMLQYKNFTLNLSFGFYWGGVQYNETLLQRVEVPITSYSTDYDMYNNLDKRVLTERWQEPGDYTFFAGYSSYSNTKYSSRFVMDDNVFKLQSASLQYRWNTNFVKEKLRAEAVNFSVNMSDLFYLSSIDRERGTDYPFANNMQFAVSINF